MWDVIIVGGGPAGLSCALVLGRGCRRVLLIDAGAPRNARVPAVSGFLTRDGITPAELRAIGRREVEGYGGVVVDDCVTAIRPGPHWEIRTATSRHEARALVLATGIRDHLPNIPGVAPFWGRTVITCPFCDGWERRGQPVAVYGGAEATEAALGMLSWAPNVALLTNSRPAPEDARLARHGVDVLVSPILRLEGREDLDAVVFSDGTRRPCAALFVHAGQRVADPLLTGLGCALDPDGCIQVDAQGRTGVRRLWACGDAATGTQLAVVAAAEGARVAVCVHRELREEDFP